MLAYIFWHRPYAGVDRNAYEAAMLRFQDELARQKPPGFICAASFRIEPVPWLGDEAGYEDWCCVEGSWALDPLNAFAVAGHVKAPHDSVAAQMAFGHGGLYAHAGGAAAPARPADVARSSVYWLTRPRGIAWRDTLDPLRAEYPQINVWRRQMVLGSAAEFAVEAPGDTAIEVPQGWQARRIHRERLHQP